MSISQIKFQLKKVDYGKKMTIDNLSYLLYYLVVGRPTTNPNFSPQKRKETMNNVINTNTRLKQVKAYLLNFIEVNQLKPEDQLPSETDIAKTLGVSRNTLREAYVELENQGVIVRRHGIGTFVSRSPMIRDSLNDFLPFAQMIKESGFTPGFKTLSMKYEKTTIDVHEKFSSNSIDENILHQEGCLSG